MAECIWSPLLPVSIHHYELVSGSATRAAKTKGSVRRLSHEPQVPLVGLLHLVSGCSVAAGYGGDIAQS